MIFGKYSKSYVHSSYCTYKNYQLLHELFYTHMYFNIAYINFFLSLLYMSHVVRKPGFFAYAKTKAQTIFAVTAKLISAFVFATRILQSLYFLNPKFQASTHLLWLYSPVCVGPGQKPRRPVFSQRGSYKQLQKEPMVIEIWCQLFKASLS